MKKSAQQQGRCQHLSGQRTAHLPVTIQAKQIFDLLAGEVR